MTTAEALDRARESFRRRAWADAFSQLTAVEEDAPLEPEDLERLATAAFLVGRAATSASLWERVHHELVRRGDAERAVRYAFWLGIVLVSTGQFALASGWLARSRRLIEDRHDCVEQGYLLVPDSIQRIDEGDSLTAHALAGKAAEIGARFHDVDLVTMARQVQGRALIRQGRPADGMTLLDEVMVAVMADEVGAIAAGLVYCSVIEACQEVFDLRRAREWTAALTHWCESQPDLVPYSGQCLVYRAEIMQLHGAWPDAVDAARGARERSIHGHDQPAAGAAFYQEGELHRLRGEFAKAEVAYRQASRRGREPQPGLARLRLARGQRDAARRAIDRALSEAQDSVTRSRLLPAHVEIMLAVDDVQAARVAADELSKITDDLDAPLLRALATHAQGAVQLAEGEPRSALVVLRHAWRAWQALEAPYEAARVRVLIGLACRRLDDEDTAEMELDAASWVFQQLGALPDLAGVQALSRRAAGRAAGGLTAREVQVLRLVAAGKTNRSVAADLFLSEKTVARHLSNIFTKLGLSTRAAATAYAYEHDLV